MAIRCAIPLLEFVVTHMRQHDDVIRHVSSIQLPSSHWFELPYLLSRRFRITDESTTPRSMALIGERSASGMDRRLPAGSRHLALVWPITLYHKERPPLDNPEAAQITIV